MLKYVKTFLMVILISTVFCTLVSFVVLFSGKHLRDGFNKNETIPMENGWILSDENYTAEHIVDLPISGGDIELNEVGTTYHLTRILPKNITNSYALSIPVQSARMTVYIDSIERLDFTGTGGLPKNNLPSSGFLMIPLSAEDSGKPIEITVSSKTGTVPGFGLPLAGEKSDILISLFFEALPDIMAGLMLIIFGIYIYVSRLFSKGARNYSLVNTGIGVFSLLLGVWELLNGGIIQLLTGNMAGMDALSTYCLILLPIPLVWHFFYITNKKYKAPAGILFLSTLIESAVLTFLVYVFEFNFDLFNPLINMMLIISVFYSIAVVAMTILRSPETLKGFTLIVVGDICIGLGSFMQLITEMFGFRTNGVFFLVGVVFYLMFISLWRNRRSTGEQKEKETAIKKAVTKSSFLANTSHEIRTPVNLIMSLNTMMKRDNNEEALVPYIKDMDSASRELKELVNKILVSARIDSGKEKLIENDYSVKDLAEYLKQAMVSMKKEGVDPVLNLSPSLPRNLKGDGKKVLAISISLIENAFKYTERGAVVVSVYHEATENQKEIRLIINVQDTGRGLSKEKEAELFQQFSTNYSEAQGAGLGLYIAARYAGMMGGDISCRRMGDCGTTFTATLIQKLSDKKAEPEPIKVSEEKKPVLIENKNILVVDDVAINVTFAQMVVKESKNNAVTALSGEDAIKASREQLFDLILMDAQMPEMDGFETLRRIREDSEGLNQNTVAYLLSADDSPDIEEKAHSVGFSGCAPKPLTKNTLLKILSDSERGAS